MLFTIERTPIITRMEEGAILASMKIERRDFVITISTWIPTCLGISRIIFIDDMIHQSPRKSLKCR